MIAQPKTEAFNNHTAANLLKLLEASGIIFTTVESCTGGLAAHLITQIPGASKFFWGAFLTYDHLAKQSLGIPEPLMRQYGSVSTQVAEALAVAGVQKLKKSLQLKSYSSLSAGQRVAALSITGIAGPGGATDKKPVGLCFFGAAFSSLTPRAKTVCFTEQFNGPVSNSRIENQHLFTQKGYEFFCNSFFKKLDSEK